MSNSTYINKLINWCAKWNNYSEKKNNSLVYLYTIDKNVGDANYNCFAYDMDTKYKGFFNGSKNGYAWCTSYAADGFCENFGKAMAQKMLGIPENSLAAVVTNWTNYMNAINRIYSSPAEGDLVFFGTQHIGIVAKVNTNGTFYTWEGNTLAGSTMINSGGQVHYKGPYSVKSTYKFGRPLWGLVDSSYTDPITTLKKGDKNTSVKEMQEKLVKLGFNTNGIDGSFGNGSYSAVVAFQKKYGLSADGVAGPVTLNKLNELTGSKKTTTTTSTTTNTSKTTTSSTTNTSKTTAGTTANTSKTSTTSSTTSTVTKTTVTSNTVSLPTLSKGMTANVYVAMMQEALKFKGYTIDVDGGFGSQTEVTVKSYQAKKGLTQDGVWGKQCWESLSK